MSVGDKDDRVRPNRPTHPPSSLAIDAARAAGRTDGPGVKTDGAGGAGGRMHKCKDRKTDGQTDGRAGGLVDGRTDGRTNGWTDDVFDFIEGSWPFAAHFFYTTKGRPFCAVDHHRKSRSSRQRLLHRNPVTRQRGAG